MISEVVTDGGVTLIGGGETALDDLDTALRIAPLLVAADGGADTAITFGHIPSVAIGDFDSISRNARRTIGQENLIHIAEQDSTDFAKALSCINSEFVIAVGFAGYRLDHTLAVMNVMVRHPRPPCIVLGAEDIVFLAPSQLSLSLAAGTRISLFPMGNARGKSKGLRWPIDGIDFAPDGRIGTSNEVTGEVSLCIEGPMLIMLPRDCLDPVLSAVTAPTSF